MKSLLVFFLWIITCIVSFAVLFPTWLFLVSVPRMFWHIYRNHDMWQTEDWDMPWWAASKATEWVRGLDKKNKSDRIRESKPVFAGS